jgi:predicted RNA binding protein YcfA (HicA-like mRNA interferase family)
MKVIKCSAIIKALIEDGWEQVACKGSHRQFKHPTKKGKVTVNGKKSTDFTGDVLKSIEKQSGLTFKNTTK